MKNHGNGAYRRHAIMVVAFIVMSALLASCASNGRVRVRINVPSDRHEKVEEKKEARAERKAEQKARVEEKKEARAERKAEQKARIEEKKEARAEAKVRAAKPGPPPHAPAHGYRHTHPDGTELVFDGNIGVYVVVKLTGIYYRDDLYIRADSGRWQVSRSLEGPWRTAASREVPPKLRSKGKGKPDGDHPGKDRVSKKK